MPVMNDLNIVVLRWTVGDEVNDFLRSLLTMLFYKPVTTCELDTS